MTRGLQCSRSALAVITVLHTNIEQHPSTIIFFFPIYTQIRFCYSLLRSTYLHLQQYPLRRCTFLLHLG